MIEGDSQPTTDKRAAEVWCRVCEAYEPGASSGVVTNSELVFVEDLSAVDNRFIWYYSILPLDSYQDQG